MSIEARLKALVIQEIEQAGGKVPANLNRSTILAETGLDSLGFATLVVTMEKELGLDPFGGTDDIIYPESFGELLDLYETANGRKKPIDD